MQSSSSLSSSSNTHQLAAAAVADSSSGAMEASGSPVPASNIPYLGSKISLISKAKIRYEGILYTIDPQESTVALAKVRSYGTENRMADHFVPPRNEVYEYIIFRATDIEDLQVSEPPRPTCLHETIRARQQMRSQPRQEEMDPAIVQHAPAATTPARIQNYATGRRRPSYNDEFEMRPPGVPPLAFINRPFRRRGPPTAPSNNGHPSPYGRGRFRPRRNTSAAPNNGLKFDGDFDFEKANEEYNRLADAMQNSKISNDEEVVECPTTQTTQTTNIGHYDKSKSFFDTISCEALEREKGSESKIRKSWQEEKQQNAETFGTVYGRFFGGGGGLGYGQQRYGGGPRRGRGGFINHGPPHPPHRFRRFNNNIQNNNEMIMQEPRQFRNDFVWAGGNYFNPGFRRGGGQIYRRNSPAVYG